MNTYYIIMSCMAVMAVIVFVALFYFKAGYGYLSSSNWGKKIGNKTAWVLMECPAFLFMLYYTVKFARSGADTGNSNVVLYIMAGLFLLHYFQRSFIFPLLMLSLKHATSCDFSGETIGAHNQYQTYHRFHHAHRGTYSVLHPSQSYPVHPRIDHICHIIYSRIIEQQYLFKISAQNISHSHNQGEGNDRYHGR